MKRWHNFTRFISETAVTDRMTKRTGETIRIYIAFITIAVFWGLSFYATIIALRKLSTFQVLQMRWGISAVIFLILIAVRKVRLPHRPAELKYAVLAGLLQPCVYSMFETPGIGLTSSSESSLFIATIPCMTLIFGILFFHRKARPLLLLGITAAFGGVLINTLFSPSFSAGGKLTGYFLLTGAVITGGLFSHASSRASETCSSMQITALMSLMAGGFFSAINALKGDFLQSIRLTFSDSPTLTAVLFLGVGCSCLCYLGFNYVIGRMNPAAASNISASLTTTVGVVSGILFAGDPFGWFTLAALGLTICGVLLSSRASTS